MDITEAWYLNQIAGFSSKNHWKARKFRKVIDVEISMYRLTAHKSRGFIRSYCSHEANRLEKELRFALGS